MMKRNHIPSGEILIQFDLGYISFYILFTGRLSTSIERLRETAFL